MEGMQSGRSQTKPPRTALFHGMRLDGLGELFPSQDSVLWNEPVLRANTTPWAELRWDELSWVLGGWSRSHLPSCSPAQGSPVILTAKQMAFLKLICFLAWAGIFLNLSTPISSFQSHWHCQAVQPLLVWKIPRQQPCPTPAQEQNQHSEAQGHHSLLLHPSKGWDPSSCTVTLGHTPKTRAALGLVRLAVQCPPTTPQIPAGDNSNFTDIPSLQSPPPCCQPCQGGRGTGKPILLHT